MADTGRANAGGSDLTAMELMQLEMFVAVVEECNVQRAADKVCRTQPAVSIALKKLAAEVGSPLFDRKHRFDYELTPTGEVLYSYATRLLALRNETVAALRDANAPRPQRLRKDD
jgi:DNA-binding transcriptional LysR family regulator